jgi:hypothetical protein
MSFLASLAFVSSSNPPALRSSARASSRIGMGMCSPRSILPMWERLTPARCISVFLDDAITRFADGSQVAGRLLRAMIGVVPWPAIWHPCLTSEGP